jgi:hypothetical protein
LHQNIAILIRLENGNAAKSINKTRYSARLAISGDKAPRIAEVLRHRGG